jgi:2-oxoglutarate ferredoxin oxidoreductase subunit delta
MIFDTSACDACYYTWKAEKVIIMVAEYGVPMPAKGWIEVSDTYCKGCELCLSACPQEVMELDMTRLTPKGYHPAHTFKDGCTGCAICALVCPDAAITVYREITKAVPAPA